MRLLDQPGQTILERHPFIVTSSLEEMQERLARAIEPRDMTVVRGHGVDVRTNSRRLGASTLFWSRYGAAVRVRSRIALQTQHLMLPLSGAIRSACAGRAFNVVPGTVLVNTPGVAVDVEWSEECAAIVLAMQGAAFTKLAHRLGEADFAEPGGDSYLIGLDSGCGRSLLTVIEAMISDGDAQDSLIDDGAYFRRLEEMLCIALLRSRPRAPARQTASEYQPKFLSRTLDYLSVHAGNDISQADLVACSGVSLRTLQSAFKRHLGTGPMSYLRNLRLDRVRGELERASSNDTVIGDIAARWGFYHLSHFTAAYRRRFGELPSQTLRGH